MPARNRRSCSSRPARPSRRSAGRRWRIFARRWSTWPSRRRAGSSPRRWTRRSSASWSRSTSTSCPKKPGCRGCSRFRGRPGSRSARQCLALLDLLGEIVLLADLADQLPLGFQPVHVVLFVDEHVLEDLAAAAVAPGAAELDPVVDPLDRLVLDGEVELELLGDGLTDVDLAQLL